MSLRDLAGPSNCSPDGATAIASSSTTPLSNLANAVLSTAHQSDAFRPQLSPPQNNPSQISQFEHTFLHADLTQAPLQTLPQQPDRPLPELVQDFFRANPHANPSPFPQHPHSMLPPQIPAYFPRNLPGSYGVVPQPELGSVTDMFERAFKNARPHPFNPPSRPLYQTILRDRFHSQMLDGFPGASKAFIDSQVDQFLAQLDLHRGNPVHPQEPLPDIARLSVREQPIDELSQQELQAVADQNANFTERLSDLHKLPQNDDSSANLGNTLDTLTTSQSWGDEFTSLEDTAGSESTLGPLLDNSEVSYNPLIEEQSYDSVMRHYLDRQDTETGYSFARTAQEINLSAQQALEEGIRHREEGHLASAIHSFEGALNRPANDPHPPLDLAAKAFAWFLLGTSLAENDEDLLAIRALQEGVDLYSGTTPGSCREDNPHLLQSLISLAVSHTNELNQSAALRNMNEWYDLWESRRGSKSVAHDVGVKYIPEDGISKERTELLRKLQKAALDDPFEIDIFIVMGVLYNLRRDYEAAADALRNAVGLRPSDPRLWNKLGATLANGGNSDEALRAYRRAVDISPSFVRAWVNVGTAYVNRSEYEKATRYYLRALSMGQEPGDGSKGTRRQLPDEMLHVWGYLHTALIAMGRDDILHLVDVNDVDKFRPYFNF